MDFLFHDVKARLKVWLSRKLCSCLALVLFLVAFLQDIQPKNLAVVHSSFYYEHITTVLLHISIITVHYFFSCLLHCCEVSNVL